MFNVERQSADLSPDIDTAEHDFTRRYPILRRHWPRFPQVEHVDDDAPHLVRNRRQAPPLWMVP